MSPKSTKKSPTTLSKMDQIHIDRAKILRERDFCGYVYKNKEDEWVICMESFDEYHVHCTECGAYCWCNYG